MAGLKPAGKGLVALIALGAVGGAYWFGYKPHQEKTEAAVQAAVPVQGAPVYSPSGGGIGGGAGLAMAPSHVPASVPSRSTAPQHAPAYGPDRVYRVAISAWPGHMGGLIGNGGLTTQRGSIADREGLKLDISIIDEPVAKNTALQSGAIDFVWQTVDELPLNLPGYKAAGVDARAFVQIDWSRGGDACVASKEVRKPEDILGRKSAVMQFSPDHTVLEFMLTNSRLTSAQVAQVRQNTAFSLDDWTFARTLFVQGKVDVACLWEPDVSLALAGRPGSHRLFSTADATNLVADVLLADARLLDAVPQVAEKVALTFLAGADLAAKDKHAAAALVVREVPRFRDEMGVKATEESFAWVRWTNLGDNAEFFGLTGKGIEFDRVYAQADAIWAQYPDAKIEERFVPSRLRDDRAIRVLWQEEQDRGHVPEAEVIRYNPQVAAKGEAVLAKPVAIHFVTNAAELDPEARFLLKTQVLPQLGFAEGMSLRVEGNTDSVGDPGYNQKLSERRAAAVKAFLIEQGSFDPNRIASKGNGTLNPVASNVTEDGRAQNRRTDILFVRGQVL